MKANKTSNYLGDKCEVDYLGTGLFVSMTILMLIMAFCMEHFNHVKEYKKYQAEIAYYKTEIEELHAFYNNNYMERVYFVEKPTTRFAATEIDVSGNFRWLSNVSIDDTNVTKYNFSYNLTKVDENLVRMDSIIIAENELYHSLFDTIPVVIDSTLYLPFTAPLESPIITSNYGIRNHPIYRRPIFHTGVDMISYSDKVMATASGVVKWVGKNGGYGNIVQVSHGEFETWYGHLDEISVEKGDIISLGDLIGKMGRTGLATGENLHYEIRYNGAPLDPKKFIIRSSKVNGNI